MPLTHSGDEGRRADCGSGLPPCVIEHSSAWAAFIRRGACLRPSPRSRWPQADEATEAPPSARGHSVDAVIRCARKINQMNSYRLTVLRHSGRLRFFSSSTSLYFIVKTNSSTPSHSFEQIAHALARSRKRLCAMVRRFLHYQLLMRQADQNALHWFSADWSLQLTT